MAEEENKKASQQDSISLNTFQKGMNKDLAKYIMPTQMYYDANNIRVYAQHEKESTAVVNVEGNEFLLELPCSPTIWEIKQPDYVSLTGVLWTTTITIDINIPGGTNETYTITLSATGGNIASVLNNALDSGTTWFLNGVAIPGPPTNIKWYFDEESRVITLWGPHNLTGTNTSSEIFNVYGFNDSSGILQVTNLSQPQCGLSIIGCTTIRDDIFLFTTAVDGGTPEALGGPGQIWKLTYDHSTYDYILECIYARGACINFTKQHPIEAIGRYENTKTQGIYWTDFFNPPRKLNTASDPMAVPCAFLDLAPRIGFTIPTLNDIPRGGSLAAGIYQCCYRYKNAEGIVSNWSPLSNKVPLIVGFPTDDFCEVRGEEFDIDTGTGMIIGKRIHWDLYDLDISHEFIEVAAVYRPDNITANVQIYIFEQQVNAQVAWTVSLDGTEHTVAISLEEFLQGVGATFQKVKTLESKDNKLFFGNVVNTPFVIDYDARSYRFDAAQNCILTSIADSPVLIDGANPYNPLPTETAIDEVPKTHDCANDYNDEDPGLNANWFTADQYKFQSNGNVLGGTGHNVSYRFVIESNNEDLAQPWAAGWPTGSAPFPMSYWATGGSCAGIDTAPQQACYVQPQVMNPNIDSMGIPAQVYPMNNSYDNYKSEFKFSLYEGYARGETYRFGIIFYNSKGSASFVNWIGDIKIPFSYDTGVGQPIGTFAAHDWRGDPNNPWLQNEPYNIIHNWRGQLWTNGIGLEFTVDLDPVTCGVDLKAHGVTGFSIVRADRKEWDKSKFGHALVGQSDRLRISDDWSFIDGAFPNFWGPVGQDVTIPKCCYIHPDFCIGGCLMSSDPLGDANINNWPWDNSVGGGFCGTGTRVFQTKQREVFLYGPLGWHNSSPANPGNLNEGLEASRSFVSGDYLKYESVFYPFINTDMNRPYYEGFPTSGTQVIRRMGSNHWYKYYQGVTCPAGNFNTINGFSAVQGIDWLNGTINNAFGRNPTNNKLDLDWAGWIGDGGTINQSADPALNGDRVMNITNPGNLIDCFNDYQGTYITYYAARPHSIGSEAVFAVTDVDIPFQEVLMGSHDTDDNTVVFTRAVVSYETYTIPYGGQTYAARASGEYIFCGHFVPISSNDDLTIPYTNTVFGGDVTVGVWDYTQYEKNWGQTQFWNYDACDALSSTGWGGNLPPLLEDDQYGWNRACMVPLEMHNPNPYYRHGYHFANKGGTGNNIPDNGTQLHDEYTMNSAYSAKNDIRTFFPLPITFQQNEEFDTRIYYSQTKINGELEDSWAQFLFDDYKDVEGVYGPINQLMRLKDTVYYFQDKGFGSLSINPTAVVPSTDGTKLQIGHVQSGAGTFIQSYTYISNKFGAKQQWAVTKSDNALYFFDILQRKLFTYGGEGTAPISDVLGMHGYLLDNLKGTILKKDNPILKEGIACTYDNRNHELYLTFHDKEVDTSYTTTIRYLDFFFGAPTMLAVVIRESTFGCNPCMSLPCEDYNLSTPNPVLILNDIFLDGHGPYEGTVVGRCGTTAPCLTCSPPAQSGDVLLLIPWGGTNITPDLDFDVLDDTTWPRNLSFGCALGTNSFTLAYSEVVKGFTSFYDFHPSIYINDQKVIITPNTEDVCITGLGFSENKLFLHDIGNYGQFYETIYPSTVTLIANSNVPVTKVFDNISYHMESLTVDNLPQTQDTDIKDDTFNQIRFYTDYQISDYINLIPGTNVKKKEREWQMAVARNVMDGTLTDADIFNPANYDPTNMFKDRMRDKYLLIDLIYNNYHTTTGDPKNIKFILHYFKTFFRGSVR